MNPVNIAMPCVPSGVVHQCPFSMVDSASWEMIRVWQDWKTMACLPRKGDVLDQDAWIGEALRACEVAHGSQRSADMERQRKEASKPPPPSKAPPRRK